MIRGIFRIVLMCAVVVSGVMLIVQNVVHNNPERAAQVLVIAGLLLIVTQPPRRPRITGFLVSDTPMRFEPLRLKDDRGKMPMAVPFGKRTPPNQKVNE